MSDLVGNPEDRFSHNEAEMKHALQNPLTFEPRCEKIGLRGFRPDPTQTGAVQPQKMARGVKFRI